MCTSNVLWSATFSAVRSSPEGEGTIVTLLHSCTHGDTRTAVESTDLQIFGVTRTAVESTDLQNQIFAV